MKSTAERMHELFRGHSGGHGTYATEDRTPGRLKTEIKKSARTLRQGPTVEMWEQHLEGVRPLGIIPVNAEGLSWWGVIDVDRYDLSHKDIVDHLAKLKLPMHVCRSKSGGAHLFVFFREGVSADRLISKLREWAALLGFGDCEIFPKQTEILEDRGDLGNWLNMPYFDTDRGTRYCVSADGRGLSVERFLAAAEASRLSSADLETLQAAGASDDPDLDEGPPCLQYLAGVGVAEGGRNNALFAFGVLAKKKFPDSWERKLEDWNRRFLAPPLPSEELLIIIKSLRRKEYSYKCKDQPICSHCDARLCKTRRFGVGADASPDIASISVLDTTPPLFFVYLTSGGTVECQADDLLSSRSFQRAALVQLRLMLPLFKQEQWGNRVQECLAEAVVIEAPKEVGSAGALHLLIEEFCTDRHTAQDKDELLLGRPWHDVETGRYYFRLQDLMSHLESHKFREMSRTQIISRIRETGGDHEFFNMRGREVNVWWMPEVSFSVQRVSHDTPRVEDAPI